MIDVSNSEIKNLIELSNALLTPVIAILGTVIAYNQYALEKDRETEKKSQLFKQKFYEPLQDIWNNYKSESVDINRYKDFIDNTIKLVDDNKDLFDYDDWKLLKTSIKNIRKIIKTLVRISKLQNKSVKLLLFLPFKTIFVILSNMINIILVVGWPEKERKQKHITIYYLILKAFISIYKFLIPYCIQRFIKFRIASVITFIAIIFVFFKTMLPHIYPMLKETLQIVINELFSKKEQGVNNAK